MLQWVKMESKVYCSPCNFFNTQSLSFALSFSLSLILQFTPSFVYVLRGRTGHTERPVDGGWSSRGPFCQTWLEERAALQRSAGCHGCCSGLLETGIICVPRLRVTPLLHPASWAFTIPALLPPVNLLEGRKITEETLFSNNVSFQRCVQLDQRHSPKLVTAMYGSMEVSHIVIEEHISAISFYLLFIFCTHRSSFWKTWKKHFP